MLWLKNPRHTFEQALQEATDYYTGKYQRAVAAVEMNLAEYEMLYHLVVKPEEIENPEKKEPVELRINGILITGHRHVLPAHLIVKPNGLER